MPRRVLIADDNPADRAALAEILKKAYTVDEAESRTEAYSVLVGKPYMYSAVITNGATPESDGHELVRQIRRSGFLRQIPVIMISDNVDEASLINAFSCGVTNVVQKPVQAALLLAMVQNAVQLRESASIVNELRKDRLTGLDNRYTFMKEAEKRIRRHEAGYYVMTSFDINHFKVINDQYGAQMGDKVLRRLGEVFLDGFGAVNGICCHIADDRFAALYPAEYMDSEPIRAIRAKASHIEGLASPLSFFVGRYLVTDLSISPSLMYDRAVLAGETVKGSFGCAVAFYDDAIRERLLYEQQIVNDMERALEAGELEPWFQPQFNHSTGAMIGSEALIRWRKNGKIVTPNHFIAVFEKNGFVYQVDKYIWRQVCVCLRRWLDQGLAPLPVSVNVSRYDLFQQDCVSVLSGLVREFDLPIDLLRLEVTETAFSEFPQQVAEIAKKLVEHGFTVEIDDFGSGYSSLNTLKDVPAQILKLDMRFLEVSHSQRGGNIVESIVRMAKWLGMSVVAEGVETLEQANYLCSVGCSYIQGYLYAKPMSVADFETFSCGFAKEVRLSALETVENLDNNTFWNPNSMETLIFNSYVGAACIFEYHEGRTELIRINRKYADAFCPGASIEDVFHRSTLENMDEQNRQILMDNIRRAIETNDESVCETVEHGWDDAAIPIYIRSTVRVIARSEDHYLLYGTVINMTAHRLAEKEERRLLTQMQNMMADMPGGFVRLRVEADGRYTATYCNEGYCMLTGRTHGELISRYAADPIANVYPDDAAIVSEALAEMLEKGEARIPRFRLLHANEDAVWVTTFGRFTRDHTGQSYLNLYFTDETAREREERNRQMLMDNFPWGAGIYAFKDGQMSLVYQNKSYWELVGLYKADFPDPAPLSAIHPDDVPLLMQKLSAAIEHQRDVICDIRLRHLKRGYRPVRLVARIVPNEAGGFLIVATFLPNEQVEMSYQHTLPLLLSTIMEASNDYAFAKDKDFRYICCSPAFVRLAGLKDGQEAVGKTDDELFPAAMAEQFRKNDLALLKSGKPMVDFQETVYSQDGTPHYCLASKHILRDAAGDGIGVYGVSRDVTEARDAAEQLRLVNDGLPGGIVTLSCKEKALSIVYYNDGFCRLFGGTREGLEERGAFDLLEWVYEEERAGLAAQIQALVESGAPMDTVFRVHVIGGGYKWINGKASFAEQRGGAVQFNAILLDVTERQNIYERLRISEEENRLAIRHGGGVICRFDVAEQSLTLSPDVAAAYCLPEIIFGVPEEPILMGMISPESVEAYRGFFEAVRDGGKAATVRYQQRYLGAWRWMEGKSSTIFSDDGKPVRAIVSLFDVTDRVEQEAIFQKWQNSMEDRAADSYTLFHCNLNRNASYESREGTLLDFVPEGGGPGFNEQARAYADQCVHEEDRERYAAFANSDAMLAGYYRGKRSDTIEYRELLPGGNGCRWLRLSVDLAEYPNSTDVGAYLMYEDIDATKRAEADVLERAENDPLTGAMNRATFETSVNKQIRASKARTTHALLMLDVDGFKQVNDILGHGAGDQALIDIAAKLQKAVRHDDFVGRLGGDEFVVFLNDIPDEKAVARKAQQVCDLMRKTYSVEVQISVSIGIALYPKDGQTFEALYEKADATLYYVKDTGKDNFAFYYDEIAEDRQTEAREQTRGADLKKLDIKRRMLIVDDNAIDSQLIANLFKDDFRIDLAYDGPSALTKMHHYGSALSVVLLDLSMPGMDGYTVLEKMQQGAGTRGVPVIVVSGNDDRDTVMRVISSGASDLVAKPIDPELLRIRVNAAIHKVENERLRAQNSLLSMLNDEIGSYQTVLERMGTAVAVSYWISGNYLYSPSLSSLLAGRFDNRPLWRILLSDLVADTVTVQRMQQLVHDIANDRERDTGQTIVRLKAAAGTVRPFEMRVYKQLNDFGLTERMILTFTEAK